MSEPAPEPMALHLQPLPCGVPVAVRLRQVLKTLLRRDRLPCLRIEGRTLDDPQADSEPTPPWPRRCLRLMEAKMQFSALNHEAYLRHKCRAALARDRALVDKDYRTIDCIAAELMERARRSTACAYRRMSMRAGFAPYRRR
jgi:hypothetical protein